MTVNSGVVRRAPTLLGHVDEHVPGEEAVPRLLGDDAHRQPVARIGAGVAVLDEQLLALDDTFSSRWCSASKFAASIGRFTLLHHMLVARRLADDELVVGRPPGVLPGRLGAGQIVTLALEGA